MIMKTILTIALLLVGVLSAPGTLEIRQPACGIKRAMGYTLSLPNSRLVSGGLRRNYAIYVPTTYNKNTTKKWPLIIDFHGHYRTGDGQHQISTYDTYTNDYIIAYPNGLWRAWQPADYAYPGVNDIQFTKDLLAHLQSIYCIDPKRVYASGMSNGGGFVNTLACSEVGNSFAAFAMASAALYHQNQTTVCNYRRPIIEAHGLLDDIIPYAPTVPAFGGPTPQIADWVSWWAARDGCQVSDAIVSQQKGYNITSYSCNGQKDIVKHYKLFNGSHCWPSSTGLSISSQRTYCTDRSLEYTPEVLDFFSKWRLP